MSNASMAAVMGVALHSSPHGHNPSTSTPSSTSSTGPPQTAHASSLMLNLYPGGVALLGVAATAAAVSAQSAPTAADVSRRMGLAPLEAAKVVKGCTVGPSVRVYDADKVFDAFNVMSSTVCDPRSSAGAYALVLAAPFVDASGVSGSGRLLVDDAAAAQCQLNVKSTGLPCGLVRGHGGHCRHPAAPQEPSASHHLADSTASITRRPPELREALPGLADTHETLGSAGG